MPSFPGSTADNIELARLDGTRVYTGDLDLGTHKVTALSPGTVGTDGVNLNQLNAVAAGASGKFGFQYTFATSTTDADPGAGLLRFNNAAPASITQIYLDLVDADGNTLTNWIASLDDALGAVKGFIYFRDIADDTKWGQYRLDSTTSPGGYVKLNVTYITSGAGGLPSTTAAGTLLSFDAWGNGPAAGNGLTGTSTFSVLPDGSSLTVSASGVKIASQAGLSVLGNGGTVSGTPAAIAGTADQVLTVNTAGTSLAFGQVQTAGIATSAVTLAKLANATASSVLGRSAASSGAYADITSSADGQVLRRGASGVIAFGAVDLADPDAVTGILPVANLPTGSATSVFARASGTSGVMASLAATADGQFLQRVAGALVWAALAPGGLAGGTATGQVLTNAPGNVPTWGALDLSDTDGVTGLLPIANIANLTALSVLGRSANVTGVMAAITGADTQVLRVSGTTLGFGQIVGAGVADSTLTLAKLANGTALSVVGRSLGSGGVYADITSTADGQVMRASGGAIGWGQINLSSANAVVNTLPVTNIAGGGSIGMVLRTVAGSVAGWGALDLANVSAVTGTLSVFNLAGGTAVGQVLRNTAGNIPAWGALDLADTDAVTGLLPITNLATSTDGRVMVMSGGVPTWGTDIGNGSDNFRIRGASTITQLIFGATALTLSSTVLELGPLVNFLRWDATATAPILHVENSSAAGATGVLLEVAGQDMSGTGATVGGGLYLRGGAAVTGANVDVTGGNGSAQHGSVRLNLGYATTMFQIAHLSGSRPVMSLFAPVNTTVMPANTGSDVLYWGEGTGPTTGVPVDGGIGWNDPTYGLSWKSKYGIETTLGVGTISGGVTANKRRVIDWKTQPHIYVATTTVNQTATSFDGTSFNNRTFTEGTIFARGKVLAFSVASGGAPNYAGYLEVYGLFKVNAGVLTQNGGGIILNSGNRFTGASGVTLSGTTIQLDVTLNATGCLLMAYFEVFAAESGL